MGQAEEQPRHKRVVYNGGVIQAKNKIISDSWWITVTEYRKIIVLRSNLQSGGDYNHQVNHQNDEK